MKILKMTLLCSLLLTLQSCAEDPTHYDYEAVLTQYWPAAWPKGCSGLADYIEAQKSPEPMRFSKSARLYLEAVCVTLDFDNVCSKGKGESFVIGDKPEAECLARPITNTISSLVSKAPIVKTDAETLFKQAYQLDDTDKYGLAYYAELVYGKDTTAETIKVQKKAIAADPQNIELLTNLAESYVEFDDTKAAIYSYQKAIKIASVAKDKTALAKSNYEIADIYYDQEDYEVALTYLKAAQPHADNSFVAFFNLFGMTYNALKDNDKAVAMYQKAIDNDKNYWLAYINLGHALNAQGKVKQAIKVLNASIKLDTEKENHDLSYYNLAISYRNTDCKQTLKYLQLALQNNIMKKQSQYLQDGVHYNFGRCYMLTKSYDKAIEALKKDTHLGDASYYFLGRAYLAKKDYQKAIEYLQQVQDVDEQPSPEDLRAKAQKLLDAQK